MATRPSVSAFLAVAIAASGCNQLLGIKDLGTGGSADIDGGPPDTQLAAFIVLQTTPAANAPAGDVDGPLLVKFSHAVDAATVSATSIHLVHRPDDAPVTATATVAGNTVTLTLDRPLDFLEPYRLTIGAGIADTTATTLGADVVVDFTARDGHWTPIAIAPAVAGDTLGGADIATGDGHFWLSWEEKGADLESYVAHVSLAGARDAPVQLATNQALDGFSLGVPQLAVGAGGTAFAFWGEIDGGLSSYINARSYDPGAGWNAVMSIASASKASPVGPVVGIDQAGTTYLAFPTTPSDFPIPASTRVRAPDGTWAAAVKFADTAYPIAVWANGAGAGASMVYADTAGIEGAPYASFDGTFHAGAYQLFVASSGTTIPCASGVLNRDHIEVAALTASAGLNTVRATVGGAFSIADATVGCPAGAIDPSGNVMLVWPQGAAATSEIHARRALVNVGLGADERIDDPLKGASTAPTVVLDDAGRAIAIWTQTDGVKPAVRGRRFKPGAGWDPTIDDLSVATTGVGSIKLIGEPSGRALALIRRDDGWSLALYH